MGEGLYNWTNSKHRQFVDGHEQLHSSVGLLLVEFRGTHWTRDCVTRRNELEPAEKRRSCGPEHNIRLNWMRSRAKLLTKMWRDWVSGVEEMFVRKTKKIIKLRVCVCVCVYIYIYIYIYIYKGKSHDQPEEHVLTNKEDVQTSDMFDVSFTFSIQLHSTQNPSRTTYKLIS